MSTGKLKEFKINIEMTDVVDSFSFLCFRIDKDSRSAIEIQRRILMGKKAFVTYINSKDSDISIRTKIKKVHLLVSLSYVVWICRMKSGQK